PFPPARSSIILYDSIQPPTGAAAFIPLLASPQGGVSASSRKSCVATEADADGVVFVRFDRDTTPASLNPDASRHFIYRSATPPRGDARRGIKTPAHEFVHTPEIVPVLSPNLSRST